MSETPELPPEVPPEPAGIPYYGDPYFRARQKIHLVVVFNYISGALDFLGALICIGVGALVLATDTPSPGDPPPALIASLYGGMGVLALPMGIVKMIAARKLQRLDANAAGWGLAMGIVGCVQFVTGSCCCLQVAAGIYTVVVMSMQDVRNYLTANNDVPPMA